MTEEYDTSMWTLQLGGCGLSRDDNYYALPKGEEPVKLVEDSGVHFGFGGDRWYVML